jgi:hypothetical protein
MLETEECFVIASGRAQRPRIAQTPTRPASTTGVQGLRLEPDGAEQTQERPPPPAPEV